jgi:hypothetical protein
MTPPILEPIIEPPLPARRLSTDLKDLLREAAGRSLSLGELEQILHGRGFALFILLLALPFSFPISIPGLSVPFGLVIMFMGLRIALGQKPSLPKVILSKQVSYALLEKIVGVGLKLCSKLERLVRPRMHFLQRWPGMQNLIGLGIASGGLLLCLPLPPLIPLSNTIPAVAVLLLTAGMIERDGVLVILGQVVNLTAWAYFIIMGVIFGDALRHIVHYFTGS